MSCNPCRTLFVPSRFGSSICPSGMSLLGCAAVDPGAAPVCSEKRMSKAVRDLSLPHTGSSFMHTHLPHFTVGIRLGSLFRTQDCQKDLSASHVLLYAAGRPSFSPSENPYIVHSSNIISASPSIIFSGLRLFRQTSYEVLVRLRAISPKKPSRSEAGSLSWHET